MGKIFQLQSGFVAEESDLFTRPNEYDKSYVDNILLKTHKHSSNLAYYSVEVSNIYKECITTPTLLHDFEYREKVLRLAKRLFNDDSFFQWLGFQLKHATLTGLHRFYIYDTLAYLADGSHSNDRELEPSQWVTLLEHDLENKAVKIDISKFFTKKERSSVDKIPSRTTDVIALWVSKPTGMMDLVISLHVIFGNRPFISDVRLNPK